MLYCFQCRFLTPFFNSRQKVFFGSYSLHLFVAPTISSMDRLNSDNFSRFRTRGNIIFWVFPYDRTRQNIQKNNFFFSNIPEYSRINKPLKASKSPTQSAQPCAQRIHISKCSPWPAASFGSYRLRRERTGKKLLSKNIEFTGVKHP